MSSSNRPVHEIKVGRIRATIWVHANDRQKSWFNVSVSRVYRDGDQWRTTSSFGRDDLPLVAKAAEMAYTWIWNEGVEGVSS